jgi:hypothetical protein
MQMYVNKHEPGSDTTEIKLRLERMPNILQDYDEVQRQLELCNELGTHNKDREEFEAMYYEVLAKMNRLLEDGSLGNHVQQI